MFISVNDLDADKARCENVPNPGKENNNCAEWRQGFTGSDCEILCSWTALYIAHSKAQQHSKTENYEHTFSFEH